MFAMYSSLFGQCRVRPALGEVVVLESVTWSMVYQPNLDRHAGGLQRGIEKADGLSSR